MNKRDEEDHLMGEVSLLLAEKRTYLSMFRTGVAIFGLSLTAIGVLIIDSNMFEAFRFDYSLLIPAALLGMSTAGGWMVYTSRKKMRRIDALIHQIEAKDKRLAEIII